MKKMIILCLVVLMLGLTVSLNAQVTFSATASITSQLTMTVTLQNTAAPTVLDFGSVTGGSNVPVIANNGGPFSYAQVTYSTNEPSWKIRVYTDNIIAGTYTGTGTGEYGELNDGSGLVKVETDGTSDYSTYLKWWCNARYADAGAGDPYFAAPCTLWDGSGMTNGVPVPADETLLYWAPKGEDLDGSGEDAPGYYTTVLTAATHSGWTEALNGGGYPHRAYDANGDGDTIDPIADLGSVFENAIWRGVVESGSLADGNKVIGAAGLPQSGVYDVYFAVTDDNPGSFSTADLTFEISLN